MVIILDEKNKQILRMLRENSRTPFLKIAKRVGCSEGLVRKRVKKMTEAGIIKGFSVNIDLKAPLDAVVCIKTETKQTKEVLEHLKKFAENIEETFEVTGRFDIICLVSASETKELNKILDALRETKNVLSTESFLVTQKR